MHSATVALLCAEPESTGIEAATQIYSPHVDHGQRLLLLDAMATAAMSMHKSTRPSVSSPASAALQMATTGACDEDVAGVQVGTVRWRAPRALEAQRTRQMAALGAQALDSAITTRRNNAVLRWTYALLSKAAEVGQQRSRCCD